MKPRLLARPSLLFFAALCWLVSPAGLAAGPGPGGSSGGHGGGGGGHAGGSAGHGGGHSGGYASGSAGHASAASSGHYSGPSASGPHVYAGSSGAAAGAGPTSGSFFAGGSGSPVAHSAATSAALGEMAAHGWTFAPSSGVTRPATSMAVRPVAPGSVTRVPVLIPSHGLPFRPRTPFATVLIRPIFGFGNGGGCFFNGFTTLCGFGFFNPFFSSIYGPGYGYGGYGYYDPGNYYVGATEPTLPADDQYPQNSGRMDIYGGYDPNALTGPAGSETTVPAPPPTQIILKSGVAFAVNSYWVSNGELYYRPVTGGLSHVPLDQLDLAATVQVNSKNGVAFTLSENVPQN